MSTQEKMKARPPKMALFARADQGFGLLRPAEVLAMPRETCLLSVGVCRTARREVIWRMFHPHQPLQNTNASSRRPFYPSEVLAPV